MELLKRYFALQEQIYAHFGYTEDWVKIPLDDATKYYWLIKKDGGGGPWFVFSDDPLTVEVIDSGERLYINPISIRGSLPLVYRATDYTMVCADTQTDGNKFLMVCDNKREIPMTEEILESLEGWI